MKFLSILLSIIEWLVNYFIRPPATKICGSEGGPPITAKRIILKDGRHLAYAESGVNKADARYKIVFCNGLTRTRDDPFPVSQDLLEELRVYIVSFDRPGCGESDPHPNRSVRDIAFDIQELADALGLGKKIYLIGRSIGNYALWGALKYIPERLAGVVLLAPMVNLRWRFPPNLSAVAYRKQPFGDRWVGKLCYYMPSILHLFMDNRWLRSSTVMKLTVPLTNKRDAEILQRQIASGVAAKRIQLVTQQGKYESFCRELKVMFGKWEFDPMDLPEPDCSVHIFQGDDDIIAPAELQRYLVDQIKWINYHELPGVGHGLFTIPGMGERILKTLVGEIYEN